MIVKSYLPDIIDILAEVDRAKLLHDWTGYSLLKKVGKMFNEAGEAFQEANKIDEGDYSPERFEKLRQEVIQVASTALRCLEGLEGE